MASVFLPAPRPLKAFAARRIESLEHYKKTTVPTKKIQARTAKILEAPSLRQAFKNIYHDPAAAARLVSENVAFNAILFGASAALLPYGMSLLLPCSLLIGLISFSQHFGQSAQKHITAESAHQKITAKSILSVLDDHARKKETIKDSYKKATACAVAAGSTFALGAYLEHVFTNSAAQKLLLPIWRKMTEIESEVGLRTAASALEGLRQSFELKSTGRAIASPEGVVETVAAMMPSILI